MLEKTLESPLDCREIQPVHPKGDQSWVFIGRTDVEDETLVLWSPLAKSWLIGKDPNAGRDWGQEEKGTTEDEMVGWHHRLNAHGFGWILGVGDGQGGLACCNSWGHKESDSTEQLNWLNEATIVIVILFWDIYSSWVRKWQVIRFTYLRQTAQTISDTQQLVIKGKIIYALLKYSFKIYRLWNHHLFYTE